MQVKAEGRVAQKVAAEVRVLQTACLCCRQGEAGAAFKQAHSEGFGGVHRCLRSGLNG